MSERDEEIALLERLGADAWRAPVEEELDGWRLRAAHGVTHRANSVLPLEDNGGYLFDDKLAAVASFSAEHGIPSAFLVTDASQPAGLDGRLAGRGYRAELPVDVLVAPLEDLRNAGGPADVLVDHDVVPDDEWIDVWWPDLGEERAHAVEMLRRPLPEVVHVSVRTHGETVAVGRGVAAEGWLGVFGMATTPAHRRRGLGRIVLSELAGWATTRGADSAYLQVTADNAAARGLYEGSGFRPHHRYWYRVKGEGPPFV